jgi:hypothetical protein
LATWLSSLDLPSCGCHMLHLYASWNKNLFNLPFLLLSFCDPSPLLCNFAYEWIFSDFGNFVAHESQLLLFYYIVISVVVVILWCVFTTWWPKQKDCDHRGLFWGKFCWNLPDLDHKPKQLHTGKETDQMQINGLQYCL